MLVSGSLPISSALTASTMEVDSRLVAIDASMECRMPLTTISSQFREKEGKFWNSALTITGYGRIQEIAFRPWQSDNIPRRYCSGEVMLSDGKMRTVHYSIIEDGGFAGFGQGVEWCVTGLDRNWAYSPGCRAARP